MISRGNLRVGTLNSGLKNSLRYFSFRGLVSRNPRISETISENVLMEQVLRLMQPNPRTNKRKKTYWLGCKI